MGLRKGELLGLKWEDIDLEHGSLRGQRQVYRIDSKIVEDTNTCRLLPLSADTAGVTRFRIKGAESSYGAVDRKKVDQIGKANTAEHGRETTHDMICHKKLLHNFFF